ncbi:MAG TPA: hypothetical protein VHX88_02150 [Solirubrobacteraceae bacterium]|jgi:cell division protein FtsQ|nr:hypothetical protein [Solirubrobacteraceae bacterium]
MTSISAVAPTLREGAREARRHVPRRGPSRRLVVILAVLTVLLGSLGWLWLRTSGLVAVDTVEVEGVSGPGAAQIRANLTRAAESMTTLDVSMSRLMASVAPLRVVRALHVSTSFPHKMRIVVDESPVVALLVWPGSSTPATSDGLLVPGAPLPSSMPTVSVSTPPRGDAVSNPVALAELDVLGGAPSGLRAQVTKVFDGPEGLTASLRGGPDLWFGDDARPQAKWLAAERVLADAGAQGISYIDVRAPQRPAAMLAGGPTTGQSGLSGSAVAGDSSSALDQALIDAATTGAAPSGEASDVTSPVLDSSGGYDSVNVSDAGSPAGNTGAPSGNAGSASSVATSSDSTAGPPASSPSGNTGAGTAGDVAPSDSTASASDGGASDGGATDGASGAVATGTNGAASAP